MSIATAIIDPLLNLHGVAAYSLVGVLAFAEAAAFVGFVLPGETAVILGGVLAYRHSVSLTLMVLIVVVAAVSGDSVGYEVGKRYGQRLLGLSLFDRYRGAIAAGQERLSTRGGSAVFVGRFTAFLRAVMPGMAGASRMPYRRFLAWNAAGGVVWGVGFTLLGFAAGASYKTIENYAGKLSYVVLAVVAVVLVALTVRRRRHDRDPAPSAGHEIVEAPTTMGQT